MSADHFSRVAGNYAAFRPTYPAALFDWLARQAPGRGLAWDCAAGSGQATVDLAARFAHVRATDLSAAQLAGAPPLDNVDYAAAPCERSGLPDASCDLVTVAQALHWFDLPAFYAEARRVLKPDGLLAAWTYGIAVIEGEAVDAPVRHFYSATVGPYWPAGREHVESGYTTLDFPLTRVTAPPFAMSAHWTLEQLLGYIESWSATGRYLAANGGDPVGALRATLAPLWGQGTRQITWPLAMLAGRP
jgi:ubiquinone/menaquinone biosynthesis C-methylase UbiE